MSSSGVDHLVYSREGKAIFWAGFVEVVEIYAYPPVLVVFLHEDRVCNPLGTFSFTYESTVQ